MLYRTIQRYGVPGIFVHFPPADRIVLQAEGIVPWTESCQRSVAAGTFRGIIYEVSSILRIVPLTKATRAPVFWHMSFGAKKVISDLCAISAILCRLRSTTSLDLSIEWTRIRRCEQQEFS